MDTQFLLLETLQLVLTSGVGGVLIVGYAAKDIFATEEVPLMKEPKFGSDYDELMWLAGRQRHHLSNEETRRFYQLRRRWTEMHAFPGIGSTPH